MALKVQAVGHRVIVKPDPVLKKSAGGILLQVDEKREQASAQKGTVVAVGDMAWKNIAYGYGIEGWKPWVKVDDRVFFARYSGKQFRDDDNQDEVYIIMNDEDIQCLIVEETISPDNSEDE
jgi:co-chaperonin GroES (HSP10)